MVGHAQIVEPNPVGCERDHPCAAAVFSHRRERIGQRLRHHHHARAAAKRPVIDRSMRIVDKVARVPRVQRPAIFPVRALRDAVLDDGRKHGRKQRDGIEPHY